MNCITWIIVWILLMIIFMCLIFKVSYIIYFFYGEYTIIDKGSMLNAGILGCSAESVDALFSFLAFVGVIVTLCIQRADLKINKSALDVQRLDSEQQNRMMKQQQFENIFFQMLNLQQNIVNEICYKIKDTDSLDSADGKFYLVGEILSGRLVFRFFFLHKDFGDPNKKGFQNYFKEKEIVKYEDTDIVDYLDHYFRHLYCIINFIDKIDILPSDARSEYVDIIRSQLSRYELVFLFYNCLSSLGNEKFKLLVERYALLKNLREELLVNEGDKEKYESSAFGKK